MFLFAKNTSAQLEGKNQLAASVGIDFFTLDYTRYFGETNRHGIEAMFVINRGRYDDYVSTPYRNGYISNQTQLLYKFTAIRTEPFDFNVGAGIRSGDGIIYPSIPVMLEAQYWLPDDKASIKFRFTTLWHGLDPVMQYLPSLGFGYRF